MCDVSSSEKERAALAHRLFGIGIAESEFAWAVSDSGLHEKLQDVAMRVLLADYLKYRASFLDTSYFFSPAFASSGDLSYRLYREVASLQLYLLCTCVDAIQGKRNGFITFPNWLHRKRSVDDDAIAQILSELSQSLDLRQAAPFRKTAHQVFDRVYRPVYGDRHGFIQFFLNLPPSLSSLVTNAFMISSPLSEHPMFDLSVWDQEHKEWGQLPETDRLKRIGRYFYDHRRSPYTHSLKSFPPHIGTTRLYRGRYDDLIGSVDYISTEDVIEFWDGNTKKYICRYFAGRENEDEALMLRLLIAMALREKLGFEVTDETIDKYRTYQVRRKAIYWALWEVKRAVALLRRYGDPADPYPEGARLPTASTEYVTKARPFLKEGTPNARNLDECLQAYLARVEPVNNLIKAFNAEHEQQIRLGASSPDTWDSFTKARAQACQCICKMDELAEAARWAQRAYWILEEHADRGDW